MDGQRIKLPKHGGSDLLLGLLALAAFAATYDPDPGLWLFVAIGSLIWFSVFIGSARLPFGLASLLTTASVLATVWAVLPPPMMYLTIWCAACCFFIKLDRLPRQST